MAEKYVREFYQHLGELFHATAFLEMALQDLVKVIIGGSHQQIDILLKGISRSRIEEYINMLMEEFRQSPFIFGPSKAWIDCGDEQKARKKVVSDQWKAIKPEIIKQRKFRNSLTHNISAPAVDNSGIIVLPTGFSKGAEGFPLVPMEEFASWIQKTLKLDAALRRLNENVQSVSHGGRVLWNSIWPPDNEVGAEDKP